MFMLIYNSAQIIEVTAVRDDIPELDETYTVSLLDPDTFGDVSDINPSANVTILANQNPYGLLEIYPADRYDVSFTFYISVF